ncbi:hypothetical protein [Turicibacter sanguinis]|uniref:hypothetical protein n=1 Tax=Turicibacter sanguinis TaxID=154288 RepID=UPI0032ECBAF8
MSNVILKRLLLILILFFSIIYFINGISYLFHWIETEGVFYSLISTPMLSFITFATLLLFSIYINHFSVRQRYQNLEAFIQWVLKYQTLIAIMVILLNEIFAYVTFIMINKGDMLFVSTIDFVYSVLFIMNMNCLSFCIYSFSLDLSTTYLLLIPIYGLSYSISIVSFNEFTEVGSLYRILDFLSYSPSSVSKIIPGIILFIISLGSILLGKVILSRRFIL